LEAKVNPFYPKKTLNLNGKILDLSSPKIMGILNITPDSFYDGGRHTTDQEILSQTEKMLVEGADLIDIGGASSRPGSKPVNVKEELSRVVKSVKLILKHFPQAVISVDTYHAVIAKAGFEEGARLINDISGGNQDKDMFKTIAQLKVPYVLMHMKGDPATMNQETNYKNMLIDILDYFQIRINKLRDLGVKDIILDPGFGFAKTIDQNYELLRNLGYFKVLNLPVLIGVSRKSTIYKTLEITSQEALNGTTVLNTVCLMNGASILRVHDVKEAVEAVKLYNLVSP